MTGGCCAGDLRIREHGGVDQKYNLVMLGFKKLKYNLVMLGFKKLKYYLVMLGFKKLKYYLVMLGFKKLKYYLNYNLVTLGVGL